MRRYLRRFIILIIIIIYKINYGLTISCRSLIIFVFQCGFLNYAFFIEHCGQAVWFFVALQKKIEFEKLDQQAATECLENRKILVLNKSRNPTPDVIGKKRLMYSFNKLDDSSVIKIISSEASKEARRREEQNRESLENTLGDADRNKLSLFKTKSMVVRQGAKTCSFRTSSCRGATTEQRKQHIYNERLLGNDLYVKNHIPVEVSVSQYIDS